MRRCVLPRSSRELGTEALPRRLRLRRDVLGDQPFTVEPSLLNPEPEAPPGSRFDGDVLARRWSRASSVGLPSPQEPLQDAFSLPRATGPAMRTPSTLLESQDLGEALVREPIVA